MRRLAPLALCLLLAACGGGPLSVIPPAELALMSSQAVPVAPVTEPVEVPEGTDPVALSFREALCAEAAGSGAALPDCAPEAAVADAAPIVAPAAISIDAMLARVRGEAAGP